MTERKSLSKKIRFEVFKRDSFTCQYCGRAAPDVVLEVDHIRPVSKAGEDDIVNLITSCRDCNAGKSDRELSDNTVMVKRKKQLDDLQERREQIEMMMEWHRGLSDLEEYQVDEIVNYFDELTPGWSLNENGRASMRKLLKKYNLQEILMAIKTSCDQYLELADEKITQTSVMKANEYIEKILSFNKRCKDKPYLRDLYYIRGILKRRGLYVNQWESIQLLTKAYLNGYDVEDLKQLAIEARNWSIWSQQMRELGECANE
jgi:hypothetical protein